MVVGLHLEKFNFCTQWSIWRIRFPAIVCLLWKINWEIIFTKVSQVRIPSSISFYIKNQQGPSLLSDSQLLWPMEVFSKWYLSSCLLSPAVMWSENEKDRKKREWREKHLIKVREKAVIEALTLYFFSTCTVSLEEKPIFNEVGLWTHEHMKLDL